MTLSIPSNFIKLAAAVEVAAENWFPGQFLLTFVEPAEREQTIKFEVKTQYADQPRTDGNAARRSLLHNVEVEPDLSSLAKFEALQEKLKRHQQLLQTVWHRFRQLLYWGHIPSKLLTDSGQVVEIPASLWLGEFGGRAYPAQSSSDAVDRMRVQLGDESFEGHVIIEAAELWRVISAPQRCRADFRPANMGLDGSTLPAERETGPTGENRAFGSPAVQDVTLSNTSIADIAHQGVAKKRVGRGLNVRMQAEKALSEIYPDGIPEIAEKVNKILLQEVRKHLPRDTRISDQTILRAAGRKR